MVNDTVIAVARRHVMNLNESQRIQTNFHESQSYPNYNASPHIGPEALDGSKYRAQSSIQALVDDVCHGIFVQLARTA